MLVIEHEVFVTLHYPESFESTLASIEKYLIILTKPFRSYQLRSLSRSNIYCYFIKQTQIKKGKIFYGNNSKKNHEQSKKLGKLRKCLKGKFMQIRHKVHIAQAISKASKNVCLSSYKPEYKHTS